MKNILTESFRVNYFEFCLERPILVILLFLVLTFIFAFTIPGYAITSIRRVVLYYSLLTLFVGLIACLAFDKSMTGFQFIETFHLLPEYNLTFSFGVDGLSLVFTILTLFIFPVCFLASWNVSRDPKKFLLHLIGMEILLVLTFTTTNLLCFFIFFESLLIPMFILIGNWGARERKIKAAYYFFIYTLFGSLFMLFGLFFLYSEVGSLDFTVILNSPILPEHQRLLWGCFFLAFAIKMPLFPFHIWLPEAHVEAPTVGSMLLASLLLKLGGYGFLRFSIAMLAEGATYFSPLVTTLSLLGVIYASFTTVRQIDMKRVIAYSSVAHMNLVMLGMFSGTQQGIEGAIYLMVGHGVVSAALFFCVGVLYDRHHTRIYQYYGGMVTVMPLFSTMFFAFTLANMSFPGTSNFLGELLLFTGIYANNSFVLLFATTGIVVSAVYSIWLYNRVCFGPLKTIYISSFSDLSARELTVLTVLLLPMIALGISSEPVLEYVHIYTQNLLISAESAVEINTTDLPK